MKRRPGEEWESFPNCLPVGFAFSLDTLCISFLIDIILKEQFFMSDDNFCINNTCYKVRKLHNLCTNCTLGRRSGYTAMSNKLENSGRLRSTTEKPGLFTSTSRRRVGFETVLAFGEGFAHMKRST